MTLTEPRSRSGQFEFRVRFCADNPAATMSRAIFPSPHGNNARCAWRTVALLPVRSTERRKRCPRRPTLELCLLSATRGWLACGSHCVIHSTSQDF